MSADLMRQDFDFFLILDFEATCERDGQINPQEVIEFPVLKFNTKTLLVDATFHQYVKPKVNQQLTEFCTELTGITQDKVDGGKPMEEVLTEFHEWMNAEGLLQDDVKSIFVTCGNWDLEKMLPAQSQYFGFSYPDYLKKWINIKETFRISHGLHERLDLVEMLDHLKIPLEGRHHSGIDDCKNIASIVKSLMQKGCKLGPTKDLLFEIA